MLKWREDFGLLIHMVTVPAVAQSFCCQPLCTHCLWGCMGGGFQAHNQERTTHMVYHSIPAISLVSTCKMCHDFLLTTHNET